MIYCNEKEAKELQGLAISGAGKICLNGCCSTKSCSRTDQKSDALMQEDKNVNLTTDKCPIEQYLSRVKDDGECLTGDEIMAICALCNKSDADFEGMELAVVRKDLTDCVNCAVFMAEEYMREVDT